jgi:hypothetical protein
MAVIVVVLAVAPARARGDEAGAARGEAARALLVLPDDVAEEVRAAERHLRAVRPAEARALAELKLWRGRLRAALGDLAPGVSRRGLFKEGAYRSPLDLAAVGALPPAERARLGKAARDAFASWLKHTEAAWDRAVLVEGLLAVSLLLAEADRARLEQAFLAEAGDAAAAWRAQPQSAASARGWVVALVNAARYAEAVTAFETVTAKGGCTHWTAAVMDDVALALEYLGTKSAAHRRCVDEIPGGRTRAPAIEPHAITPQAVFVRMAEDLVANRELKRYLEVARDAFVRRPRERALCDYLLAVRCVELTARGRGNECRPEEAVAGLAAAQAHPWVAIRGGLLAGRLRREAGRYEESLDAFRAARDLARRQKAGPTLDAEAAVEEGNARIFVNDVEGASKKYGEVEKLLGAVRSEQGEARAAAVEAALRGNRALLGYARLRLDAARGDDLDQDVYEQARGDLVAAKRYFATIGEERARRAHLGAAGNNLVALHALGARAFHDAGKRRAALAAAVVEVKEVERAGDGAAPHAAAVAVNQCAVARLQAADGGSRPAWAAARAACERAVTRAAQAGVATYRFRALHERALVRAAAGDRRGAATDFEEGLRAVEAMRRALGDTALRANFLYDKDDFFADAVRHFALEAGDAAQALRFAEHARARRFLDVVERSREGRRKGVDAEALRRLAVPAQPHRLALGPRTFVIAYYLGRDFAVALVVRPDQTVVAVPLAKERKALDELCERWRKQVMTVLDGLTAAKLADAGAGEAGGRVAWQRTLAELHERLFKPVDDRVIAPACKDARDGECTVGIVGHGLLHHVPFAALVTRPDRGDWPRPRYVIDRYAVFYAPSLSSLGHVAARRPGAARSLVVTYTGEDLPAVRREIERVKRRLPQVVELQGSAPRARLLEELAQRTVVLIAAHGVLSADEPLASKLIVAPDAPPVTLADVMKLKLDGETVYLSACETAQVVPFLVAGDDYLSLGRGFIAAGARQVVATLWQLVDVAGGEVSTSFFDALYGGDGRRTATPGAQALRGAMLRALDHRDKDGTPIGRSPIFWAPFALTGDPR